MRENLPQWDFVIAAYAIGLLSIVVMIAWSWSAMRHAERRRDETRRK